MIAKLAPNKIYDDYRHKKISKEQALDQFISIIEDFHGYDDKSRILAVKFIGLLNFKREIIFTFLENLLISDLNDQIRGEAARIIISNFADMAINPISWVLKRENNNNCLPIIIKTLERTSNKNLRSLLKIKTYIIYKGNIFFPSHFQPEFNLSNKNIDDIKNLKNLENFTYLEKLNLNYNQITQIQGLDKLVNLKALYLQGNRIKKIENLLNLKSLEFVYLNNNKILEIEGVDGLYKLKSLILFDNFLSEIKNLKGLPKLEVLNLRNNQIKEIKGLEKLSSLRRLDISNNNIEEIKGLKKLTKLEFLDLSYNKINEIKGLANLRNLKFLDLRNNNLTSLKGLEKLKNLDHLYIGFNKITDLKNIEKFRQEKILDIKNSEELLNPKSLRPYFQPSFNDSDYQPKFIDMIWDIKYIPLIFGTESIINDLKIGDDYVKYFTDSTWMIILKNNKNEIFRVTKSGKIKWVQRSNR
ncbi:MAG: leucine-rich repeat domain-containing protein [Promethearchaeota archaeon]